MGYIMLRGQGGGLFSIKDKEKKNKKSRACGVPLGHSFTEQSCLPSATHDELPEHVKMSKHRRTEDANSLSY